MSLLDQLWDDTLAGPPPDSGLGKLRKHHTFSLGQNSGRKESGNTSVKEGIKVTRSIMIMKPQGTESPPISPAGSTPPLSPFAVVYADRVGGTGGGEAFRFRRRSISDVYEKANGIRPGSPRPPHDL